jgi:hypothetical protein
MLGCGGYIVNFVGNTMFENFGESLISNIASKPAALGEIGTCLWLLIRGINEKALAVGMAEEAKGFFTT